MPLLKTSNINTAQKSKMVRIELHNLQTRLAQFKDQKKLKMYLIVSIEPSLYENRLNFLSMSKRKIHSNITEGNA